MVPVLKGHPGSGGGSVVGALTEGLCVPRERGAFCAGDPRTAPRGLEIEAEGRVKSARPYCCPQGAFTPLITEPAPRPRVGHFLEAVCQVFLYSSLFRIPRVINTFPF